MKYGVIYLDPPWDFKNYSAKGEDRNPNQHYPCMTQDELFALPVPALAADDCVIHMWICDTHLLDALALIKHWGFTYKCIGFVWDKDRLGLGYWTRKGGEVCLLATKGSPKRTDAGVRQWIRAAIREHSRKPSIHSRIEALSAGPYCEMFARQRRENWTVWGNQVDKFTAQVTT